MIVYYFIYFTRRKKKQKDKEKKKHEQYEYSSFCFFLFNRINQDNTFAMKKKETESPSNKQTETFILQKNELMNNQDHIRDKNKFKKNKNFASRKKIRNCFFFSAF